MEPKTYFGYQEPFLDGFENLETQFIRTLVPLNTVNTTFVNPISTPILSDKITISTTVYDEYSNPLPGANIWIDGKWIAETNENGSVVVTGAATSISAVKITHVSMKDYSISAVFLPKKVMMQVNVNELNEVIIKPKPKATTTPTATTTEDIPPVVQQAGMSWVMWLLLLGGVYKGMQYFKDSKPKTVKAKI
ncbi:hypothetical protein ACM55F_09985 [Flavobacterium sp. XS2P12]|uniref:hypothetical protein n=1 Tax=Flavobacterium melibiosi TaxID=3398734 RepID=UPI003A884FB7